MKTNFKQVPPPLPPVSPRLWFTAVGVGLAGLSLCFQRELWPHQPQAPLWSAALLVALLLWGWFQGQQLLLRWVDAYAGPRWMRFLLKAAALGLIAVQLTVCTLLLLGTALFVLW